MSLSSDLDPLSNPADADRQEPPSSDSRQDVEAVAPDSSHASWERWSLAAILLVAVVVRVWYFWQLNTGPLVDMHRWDQSDMSFYDFWARSICAGDWTSRNVRPPMHAWHIQVAKFWLDRHPEVREELEKEAKSLGDDITPGRILWRRWLGRQYYQEPFYPYLLAFMYGVLGVDHRCMLVLQMVLGVLSVILMYRITLRHFGPAVAVCAGLLAAVYTPTLTYEGLLLRDAWLVFFALWIVDLTEIAFARSKLGWWALLGLVIGLATLTKGTYAVYFVGLLVMLSVDLWRDLRALAARAAVLTLGIIVTMLPVVARNIIVGAPPLPSAGNAGIAFILLGNGLYRWEASNPVETEVVAPIMGETECKFLPAVIATLKTHSSVWSVIWMTISKFDATFHWWERPDNVSSYFYDVYAPILRWLPLHFGFLAAPGLVGLVLAVRRFHRLRILYLMVAAMLIPMVAFTPIGRYRLPLAAVLIPFVAFCVVQVVRWFRDRQWRTAAVTTVVVLILALWTNRSLPTGIPLARGCDYAATFGYYYQGPAQQAIRAHQWERAAELLADFTRHEPYAIRNRVTTDQAANGDEQIIAAFLAAVHYDCGFLRQLAGDPAAAGKHFQRAAELRKFARQ